LELEPKTMGKQYYRVRGASPKTKWSEPLSVKVVPKAPVPLTPDDGSKKEFKSAQIATEFRWKEVPNITVYDLEVVRVDGDTEEPPKTHRVEAATASLALQEGRYRWTVRAVHASGASSQRSKPRSFELGKKGAETTTGHPGSVELKPRPSLAIEDTVEPSEPAALYLAPLAGFQYNFGAIFAPRFGIEIAYLLPILNRHIRLALSGSYLISKTTHSSEQGDESFESHLHGFPIELTAAYIFYTSIIDVSIGGGLSLNLLYRQVEIPSQPTVEQTDVELGGVIFIGVARTIGPGSLFSQVSYVLTTRSSSETVENLPGGLGAILGYHFGIW
jgi:hypothetical protein